MDKPGIKNFAIEARNILRESAIKKAGVYGITVDDISEPVQKLPDSEVFKTIAGDEIRLFADDLKKRNNLVSAIRSLGFEQVIVRDAKEVDLNLSQEEIDKIQKAEEETDNQSSCKDLTNRRC